MNGVASRSAFVQIHSSTTDYPIWRSTNCNKEAKALNEIKETGNLKKND